MSKSVYGVTLEELDQNTYYYDVDGLNRVLGVIINASERIQTVQDYAFMPNGAEFTSFAEATSILQEVSRVHQLFLKKHKPMPEQFIIAI